MKQYFDDDLDFYEEQYGTGGFIKSKGKKRNDKGGRGVGKGHQKRKKEAELWMEISEESASGDSPVWNSIVQTAEEPAPVNKEPIDPTPTSIVSDTATLNATESKKVFVPGPNTHTIKGNIVDFDHVANVEKVENEKNGILTYGIKFLFQGKKGNFRIAWFNKNYKERDRIFQNEYEFWTSLKK